MAKQAIELVQQKHGGGPFDQHPMYHVILNGEKHGELYFNMTGYTGCYLPTPPSEDRDKPGNLDIGERGITAYKNEIARLNREWTEHTETFQNKRTQ